MAEKPAILEGLKFDTIEEAERKSGTSCQNWVTLDGDRFNPDTKWECHGCIYVWRKRQAERSERVATVMTFSEAGEVVKQLIAAGVPKNAITTRFRSWDEQARFVAVDIRERGFVLTATVYSPQRVRIHGNAQRANVDMSLAEYLEERNIVNAVVTVDQTNRYRFHVTAPDGFHVPAPAPPYEFWDDAELRRVVGDQGNVYTANGKRYRLVRRPQPASPPAFLPEVAE